MYAIRSYYAAFSNVKVWNNLSDHSNKWETQSDKQNNLENNTTITNMNKADFTLVASGSAIDYGRVIDGYTDGFVGSKPDVGAYELGDSWVPGINWDIKKGPAGICYGLPGEPCGLPNEPNTAVKPTAQHNLFIYPNPTSDYVTVSADVNWALITMNGTILKRGTGNKVAFNDLAKGLYILRAGNEYFKVIKEN